MWKRMKNNPMPLIVCMALALVFSAWGCGGKKVEKPAKERGQTPASGAEQKAMPATPGKKTGEKKAVTPKATESEKNTNNKTAPQAEKKDAKKTKAAPQSAASAKLVPLKLKLPKPVFAGTPKNIPAGTTVEKPTGKPRPPLMVPPGVKNMALGKTVSSSDEEPIIGDLDLITDGDKEGTEGSYVELGPGLQYVQIDLGQECKIYAVVVWHYHGDPRVYHDVIAQVADDPDFVMNVKTLFNNDHDNSAGLGIGKDREYIETYKGKLIDAKGVKARYIRLFSGGSTGSDMNHYIEVEVYGK